ncbi:hypothetical protein [Paenibacillus dendritiformis]|uniref:hypothetical protein n=1 Tax=Paenibacillus dendritiformis TaxID=130049 RepID=UPI001FD1403C|nr:hypothetical protein [Paenibacillus dendritiformis]
MEIRRQGSRAADRLKLLRRQGSAWESAAPWRHGFWRSATYVPNQEQAASELGAIQFNFVWLPFICFMLCVGLLFFYRLENVEQRITQDLEAKLSQGGKAAIQA